MADERIVGAVKLVDPTTTSQQATVSASGNLSVILAANTGVDIGDVDVLSLPNSEADDDIVAGGGTAQRVIGLNYGWDGVQWERLASDAAGSLDVNVTLALPAGANAIGKLAANTGVDIGDVDVTSVIPGTAATNLGKAENAASGAADTLVGIAAVQDAALAALASIDGDYTWLRVDANGALWTHDDALDAALAGAELQVDVVAALPTGANTVGSIASITTSVVPGTAATDLGKAEDAAHVTGDVGVMSLAVRQDTAAALAGTAGDYIPLIVDANGRLHVTDPNAGAGVPTSPVVEADTAVAVAAGADSGINLQTADLGGTTRQLRGVDISASVPFKFIIQEVLNAVATAKAYGFGRAGETVQWRPPHKGYFNVVFAAQAGFDGWRALVTNMDTSEAADLYANFYYED